MYKKIDLGQSISSYISYELCLYKLVLKIRTSLILHSNIPTHTFLINLLFVARYLGVCTTYSVLEVTFL